MLDFRKRPTTIWPENATALVEATEPGEARLDELGRGLGSGQVADARDRLDGGTGGLQLGDEVRGRVTQDEVEASGGQPA